MNVNNLKNELENHLQGKSHNSNGTLIQTVANYLRGSQKTSTMVKGGKQFKEQETEELIKIINQNHLCI